MATVQRGTASRESHAPAMTTWRLPASKSVLDVLFAMSNRERSSALRALDKRVLDGTARWWFIALAAMTLAAALAVAAVTHHFAQTLAALVTPLLIAVGVVLGARWNARR